MRQDIPLPGNVELLLAVGPENWPTTQMQVPRAWPMAQGNECQAQAAGDPERHLSPLVSMAWPLSSGGTAAVSYTQRGHARASQDKASVHAPGRK